MISIGKNFIDIQVITVILFSHMDQNVIQCIYIGVVDIVTGGDFGFFHIGNTDDVNQGIGRHFPQFLYNRSIIFFKGFPVIGSKIVGSQKNVEFFTFGIP